MTHPVLRRLSAVLPMAAALLLSSGDGCAASPAEQATSQVFNAIKADPNRLIAFLRQMPKGGDLHNHISGAIFAESYIDWASQDGLCHDAASLALTTCAAGQPDLKTALAKDAQLYDRLVDAWSMRNLAQSNQNGHDHFFDAFGKFGAATGKRYGDMLAEVANRSAGEKLSYLELLLTPASDAKNLPKYVAWTDDLAAQRRALLAYQPTQAGAVPSIASQISSARAAIDGYEKRKNELLKCDTPQAAPGCQVQIRYLSQISRALPLPQVYAQMVVAAEIAQVDSRFVGLNLVQPEDDLSSLTNFRAQMGMLDYLHGQYPKLHISLHAGELAPGLVPPEEMRFHIAESVRLGHAERIGHGVDIMHEDQPYAVLKEMADKGVLVEVCLSSNDGILGIRGKEHPFKTYQAYGVAMALATDDAGIARSDISREYLKAVADLGVAYSDLKRLTRASLEHAFIEGASLWRDGKQFKPVAACAKVGATKPTPACDTHLKASAKARLQWTLEQNLAQFEQTYSRCLNKAACP